MHTYIDAPAINYLIIIDSIIQFFTIIIINFINTQNNSDNCTSNKISISLKLDQEVLNSIILIINAFGKSLLMNNW